MLQATYEKGTKDEIEEFMFRLVDVSGDNFVGRYNIETSSSRLYL